MAVTRDRRASGRRLRGPRARLRAGAERLRPPLHVLHHPVRPRQFALGADGRGGRRGAPALRARLSRGRAHRRRSHELWRKPAGRAEARPAGEADPQARAGARAAAALVDRFDRGRPRPARRVRQRAAADAAPASVAAGRRRPDPQAHEAAASARRRDRVLRSGAAAAARRRVRRRHHRRLPDRDRGDVRALARSRRRMRADASARLSVLAAPRHAGRAHAAGRARDREGARAAAARKGAAALRRHLEARSARRAACWPKRGGIGRTEHFTPVRLTRRPSPARSRHAIAGHDGRQLLAA